MPYTNRDGGQRVARPGELLRWQLGRHYDNRPRTPATGVPVPFVPNDGMLLRHAAEDALTWIGHAAFLLQLEDSSSLIDPVLSPSLGAMVQRNHMNAATLKRPGATLEPARHHRYQHQLAGGFVIERGGIRVYHAAPRISWRCTGVHSSSPTRICVNHRNCCAIDGNGKTASRRSWRFPQSARH